MKTYPIFMGGRVGPTGGRASGNAQGVILLQVVVPAPGPSLNNE